MATLTASARRHATSTPARCSSRACLSSTCERSSSFPDHETGDALDRVEVLGGQFVVFDNDPEVLVQKRRHIEHSCGVHEPALHERLLRPGRRGLIAEQEVLDDELADLLLDVELSHHAASIPKDQAVGIV